MRQALREIRPTHFLDIVAVNALYRPGPIEFILKYGTPEDWEVLAKQDPDKVGLIAGHSYMESFWVSYGIFGLIFWLYVLFVFVRYLRQDCWVMPQWYMWLAASIPGYCWGIFFSPWSDRVGGILFVVACLMTRAVRKGRQPLPMKMIREIEKSERALGVSA